MLALPPMTMPVPSAPESSDSMTDEVATRERRDSKGPVPPPRPERSVVRRSLVGLGPLLPPSLLNVSNSNDNDNGNGTASGSSSRSSSPVITSSTIGGVSASTVEVPPLSAASSSSASSTNEPTEWPLTPPPLPPPDDDTTVGVLRMNLPPPPEVEESYHDNDGIDILSPLPASFVATPSPPAPGSSADTLIRKGSSGARGWSDLESPMSPPVPTTHLTMDDIPSRTYARSIAERTGYSSDLSAASTTTYRPALSLALPPTRQRGATWSPAIAPSAHTSMAAPPSLPINSLQPPPISKSAQRSLLAAMAAHAAANGGDSDDARDSNSNSNSNSNGDMVVIDDSSMNESDQTITPLDTSNHDHGASFRASSTPAPPALPFRSRRPAPSPPVAAATAVSDASEGSSMSSLKKKAGPPPLPTNGPPPLPPNFAAPIPPSSSSSSSTSSSTSSSSPPGSASSSPGVSPMPSPGVPISPIPGASAPARPNRATVAQLFRLANTNNTNANTNTSSTSTPIATPPGSNTTSPLLLNKSISSNTNSNNTSMVTDTDAEWNTDAIDRAATNRLRSQSYAPVRSKPPPLPSSAIPTVTASGSPVVAPRPPRPQLPAHVRAVLNNNGSNGNGNGSGGVPKLPSRAPPSPPTTTRTLVAT